MKIELKLAKKAHDVEVLTRNLNRENPFKVSENINQSMLDFVESFTVEELLEINKYLFNEMLDILIPVYFYKVSGYGKMMKWFSLVDAKKSFHSKALILKTSGWKIGPSFFPEFAKDCVNYALENQSDNYDYYLFYEHTASFSILGLLDVETKIQWLHFLDPNIIESTEYGKREIREGIIWELAKNYSKKTEIMSKLNQNEKEEVDKIINWKPSSSYGYTRCHC